MSADKGMKSNAEVVSLVEMTEETQPKAHKMIWVKNISFLVLGILTLLFGSFLILHSVGPEAIIVLLIWILPFFVR